MKDPKIPKRPLRPGKRKAEDEASAEPTEEVLVPRIIREGLIDEILVWMRDYLAKLAKGGSEKYTIAKLAQAVITIEALKDDLQCIERAIDLVGRNNAEALVDYANKIRTQIFDLYEQLASDS
ncbi:MAG: hypothetical protein ABIH23_28935 [bacterium]